MNILAVDTSALTATVAIFKDGVAVFENNITNTLTHSETLMPMIDYALKSVKMDIADIDLYAVSQGPGSFTGIRIGVSAIKALAYATNKKIFGINTLKALAYNLSCVDSFKIVPIMDARRSQVYYGIYEFKNGNIIEVEAPDAISVEDLCAKIDFPCYFVGDGVRVHRDTIKNALGEKALFAPEHMQLQKAASIAYAATKADEDEFLSPEALEVIYLRKSQAEREREEKERID